MATRLQQRLTAIEAVSKPRTDRWGVDCLFGTKDGRWYAAGALHDSREAALAAVRADVLLMLNGPISPEGFIAALIKCNNVRSEALDQLFAD